MKMGLTEALSLKINAGRPGISRSDLIVAIPKPR
jgi:hypothetical protein